MDKKYRDTVPDIVKDLPAGSFSDDENEVYIESLRKKSRKSKKQKIRKNGLYSEEELDIARWWISRGSVDNHEYQVGAEKIARTRILAQKARETQLQIILVLETLALEMTVLETEVNQLVPDVIDSNELSLSKKQKPSKHKDLHTLLDLLLDRLCIWQSTHMFDGESPAKDDKTTSQQVGRQSDQMLRPNDLRNFCVDVVLPL